MGSDCGPGGSQSRAVWCAHSEGWTTLHTNCDQSKRPDNQQSCFRVCDWHKELYDWQLGAWNQCLPVSMRNAGVQRPIVCTRGEEGIQTREVGCVLKADGEPAEDAICEYFEPKPRLEQACLIPCPRDCVVSEFSPWTQCSKTCGIGLQNRIRFVLAPPLFGGSACPNLTEFHTCQPGNCEGEESLYSLRVGPWGLCSIPVSRQARQADKPPREEGKPSKESEKPSKEGDKPSRESEKTSKGGDKQSKEGVKVTGEAEKPSREGDRPRKDGEKRSKDADKLSKDGPKPSRPNRKLGRANRKPDRPSRQADRPKRQKKAKNKEKREKIREKVRERLRERGKAKDPETRELIKKKRTKNRQNRPGGKFWDLTVGYQTREVSCVHKSGNVEALSLCSQYSLPITFQACVMTKDCDVTEWSDWSACSKECYNPNGPKGDRTRSRKVSQFPIDGGADCPELLEKESCTAGEEVPPALYNWKSTEWTECRVDVLLSQQDRRRGNQTGLWGGLQTREVYCVQTSSETPPTSQPSGAKRLCHISCPLDCFKLRKRRVSNEPTGGTGTCAHLVEAVPCEEPGCYDWLVLRLEDCTPDNERECGAGTQIPQVQCVNSDGEFVERQLCRDAILPMPALCEVPCPKDCALSPWTSWTLCVRCPNISALQEVRGCNDHPCTVYHWQTGAWGQCIEDASIPASNASNGRTRGDDASCSVGMQTRKVICVRVNVGQCFLCLCSGGNTKKKQFRKRIVIQTPANGGQDCPEVLNQERECEAPSVCQGYRWKIHKWRRCQLVPWSVRQDSVGALETCGPAVSCRKQDGGQADVEACLQFSSSMPPLTQLCQLPCEETCQLSLWSKFSSCSVDCVGVRTRKRTLVGKSKKRDQCKNNQVFPLSETQYCPCNKYNAQPVGNWSDCVLPDGGRLEGSLGMKVQGDIKECYIEEACIIPCPSDCKLSEWSNWSRCSKSCGSGVKVYEVVPCLSDCGQYVWMSEPWSVWKVSNVDLKENCGEGVQTRKVRCMLNTIDGPSEQVEDYLCDPEEMPLGARNSRLPCPEDCVLSDWGVWTPCPLPGDGKTCPPSEETEICKLNTNCFHYSYNITDWSTCQLSERAVCGNGIKTRMLDCVRSDGKSLGLDRKWQMNASCVVECPVNCQLSDWSTWSECTHTCGLADEAVETLPGEALLQLELRAWSDCKSEEDSSLVEEELCSDLQPSVEGDPNIVLQEPCTVPCPGECYLTDWNRWSPSVWGDDLGFGSVQVVPVVAQDPENLLQGSVFRVQVEDRTLEGCISPRLVPALRRTQRHR
ncbi:hypothetical protein F7725_024656 [Dissostichus mawsoni]|uniref:Spondin-like TSP1 domain-containing protein n=1 Tax=Dissostichus mawsoni TaxID=36200 RepID=A0A7J5X8Z8_DISMA|nr:hypothetical protein F7725_024656 [Dissostichus mawsoni]